jgi:hypothetical protein
MDLALFDGGGANYSAINTLSGSTITFPAGTTVFPQSGLDSGAGDFMSSADVNNDGFMDFFYHLNSGRLFASSASGSAATWSSGSRGISATVAGSGSAWGDFNNDGWVDLWVCNNTAGQGGSLWRSPGATGNFVNVNGSQSSKTTYARIADTSAQRGCAWGDYDNDGFLDLAIATSSGVRLYRNNGDSTFTLAFQGASALGDVMDVCFVDYDNDGDLDLVATLANTTQQRLFENISNIVTPNTAYLKVRCVTPDTTNAYTVGDLRARVELRSANGVLLQRRDVGVARGFGGSEPFWAHFGGLTPSATYTVTVAYPGGSVGPTTVIPSTASTTIGTTTIPQMLTVQVNPATRKRVTAWTQANPSP